MPKSTVNVKFKQTYSKVRITVDTMDAPFALKVCGKHIQLFFIHNVFEVELYLTMKLF